MSLLVRCFLHRPFGLGTCALRFLHRLEFEHDKCENHDHDDDHQDDHHDVYRATEEETERKLDQGERAVPEGFTEAHHEFARTGYDAADHGVREYQRFRRQGQMSL